MGARVAARLTTTEAAAGLEVKIKGWLVGDLGLMGDLGVRARWRLGAGDLIGWFEGVEGFGRQGSERERIRGDWAARGVKRAGRIGTESVRRSRAV